MNPEERDLLASRAWLIREIANQIQSAKLLKLSNSIGMIAFKIISVLLDMVLKLS